MNMRDKRLSPWSLECLTVGQALHGMDYDAIAGEVYAPDQQTNQITILQPIATSLKAPDKWPSEPLRALAVSGGPAYVAVTSDGSLGIVGQQSSGSITFLQIPAPHQVLEPSMLAARRSLCWLVRSSRW